ncbi:MAG: tRNA (adenosine(37)-N6)-dimethylallyltransferase MiaA [Firmicutes bacterium]|nr:tRNA (adenosine(37)-N6)-dimethylallyltransferase MiaA [Bacillota bacterium]
MKKIISIVGTTASGKSGLGVELAKHFDGEIISADSRQVYKHLDIGSGKITKDEMNGVRHHLIDVACPFVVSGKESAFSLAKYLDLAYKAIDDVLARGKLPFLVGGTGMYSRAIVEGYSLRSGQGGEQGGEQYVQEQVSGQGKQGDEHSNKPRFNCLQLGLTYEKDVLHKRIETRLDKRLCKENGLIGEVESLLNRGISKDFLLALGLEYKLTSQYLAGYFDSFKIKNLSEFDEINKCAYKKYRSELFKEIRRFAKRQLTWYAKEKQLIWLDTTKNYTQQAKTLITEFLNK